MRKRDIEQARQYARKYRAEHKEKVAAYQKHWRAKNKGYTRKYYHRRLKKLRPELNKKQREYYAKNQEKYRSYRIKRRDKDLVYQKQWRNKNRDKWKARRRRHYLKHRVRRLRHESEYRKRNRDRVRQWCKNYRKKFPERVIAYNLNRRTRLMGAKREKDRKRYLSFIRRIKSAKIRLCFYCKKPTTKKNRHVDHYIPLSRGGSDTIKNLRVACKSCNCKKCNKMPREFMRLLTRR